MPIASGRVPSSALEAFLALSSGGGNGVIRNHLDEGEVIATTPVGMTVLVGAFRGYIALRAAKLVSAFETAAFVAPTGGSAGDVRRIDTIQYSLSGGVEVKTGIEAPSPVAVAVDADALLLAWVYLRTGMTSIKNSSDGTNGYIVDKRVFV